MVGFGTALAGYGNAQPQIQAMDAIQMKKNQDAALAKVLQQYAASQQNGQPPQGQPSAMPLQGGQPPIPGGAPPMPGMPAGAPRPPGMPPAQPTQAPPVAPPPPQGGGQGNFAGGMPDLNTMITLLSKSGIPADQQFEALKSYGAFASPFEKMMSQLEIKQMQIDNAATMTSERLKMMETLKAMGEGGADNRQDKKLESDDYKTQLADMDKAVDDARKDRDAYIAGGDKSRTSPEAKTALQNYIDAKKARDEFKKSKGKSVTAAPATPDGSSAAPAGGSASAPSQEDLEFTAKKYGMTVDEVKAKLGAQ